MATGQLSKVIGQLCKVLAHQDTIGLADGDLLKRYVRQRDEAAFEALIHRHGPMVMGVCCRVLHNAHDAEDAFQATFLVLVRKASTLRSPSKVGNWLYGVAYRTAHEARKHAAKRRSKEAKVVPQPQTPEDTWTDLLPVLDQELERLPDKYRTILVLCDLEGKTRKEAARQLGVPEGTVASRLATARTKLAKRLVRHGLAVSGGTLAEMFAQNVMSANVTTSVVSSTIKAASLFAAGKTASGVISIQVVALTKGVLNAMLLAKLKTASLVLLVVFVLGSGLLTVSAFGSRPAVADDRKRADPETETPKKGDVATVPALASEVLLIFDFNEALGEEKFARKQLQVTGRMHQIRRYGENYALTMLGDIDTRLWFEFETKHRKQLAALGLGADVTIRGQCDGRTTVKTDGKDQQIIRFRNCEIVQTKRDDGAKKGPK